MNNFDILNDDFYKLPKSRYDSCFRKYISENLTEYLNRLENFTGEVRVTLDQNKPKIEYLCSAINEAITYYLEGLPVKAYNSLSPAIDNIKAFLLYRKDNRNNYMLSNGKVNYYRIRESFKTINAEGIFHPPFQIRHKVKSTRFSIPGVPSLYLSNSLFLCWVELKRPNNKRLYASRFEFNQNKVNLINLSYIPQRVVSINDAKYALDSSESIFLEETIITWPLLFTTSIMTKYHDAYFQIEYIIPQLLLQWCQENTDIDGIAYYSTRANYLKNNNLTFFNENLVFVVKSNLDSGHCPILKKIFKVTDPVKISRLRHLRETTLNGFEKDLWSKDRDTFTNYYIRKRHTHEKSPSIFDRVEIELLKSQANFLNP